MSSDLTRRELIRAGGVGAAGIALLGAGACDSDGDAGAAKTTAQAPANAMNVVVVVMDSLRADHVYGPRARTDAINKVMQAGVRFTNAYPEGMPTIPARRAIMAGRRTYPFRGWKPKWDDLPPQPGWEPVGSDGEMWTEVLRRNGWTTGYVTDNPHLLLPVHKRFRRRFDRVELVDGQVPVRRKPTRHVSQKQVNRHLPPSMRDGRAEPRMAAYLAVNPRDRREEDFNAAKVFRESMGWIEWASTQQPFALVIDSFDAHEPWDAPRRLVDLTGRRAPTASSRSSPSPRRRASGASWAWTPGSCGGCASSTRQRSRSWTCGSASSRQARGAGPRAEHAARAGERPRSAAGRVRLGWQALLGDASGADARAARAPPSGRQGEGSVSTYDASTHDIGPTVLRTAGVEVPGHMNGVDLSPVFDGKAPAKKRGYRTSAYNTYVSAGDDRRLLIAGNRREELRLYDRKADPGETRNVARQHPQQVRRLWNLILKDAGPKGLPRFPKGGGEG